MALFLVQKNSKGKTYGVYDVIVNLRDEILGPDIRFLIWNGMKWEVVPAYTYVPEELEYFGEDGESDGRR